MDNDLSSTNLRARFLATKVRTVDPHQSPVTITINEVVAIEAKSAIRLDPWLKQNLDKVNSLLLQHGAIRFRGFDSTRLDDFVRFNQTAFVESMDYTMASSPRREIDRQVYTSTDHPPEETIHMHSELSYAHDWPGKLAFFCEQPATWGGATMVADTRKLLKAIPVDMVAKFRRHGIRYSRYLTATAGLPWSRVFGTDNKQQVEQYCRQHLIDFCWQNADALKISWHRPAVVDHPVSKQSVWFNHGLFFHQLALPDVVQAEIAASEQPFSSCYGDGSAISTAEFYVLKQAYEALMFDVVWQAGDILLLDNLLMAHGRRAFGGTRKVRVAMAEPLSDQDCN